MRSGFVPAAAAAALITAGAASSVLAADVYDYPPQSYGAPLAAPPPELYTFAGWYFGATAGYSSANFSTSGGSVDASGAVGGGLLGWNWQDGPIAIGLEGDVLAADDFDGDPSLVRRLVREHRRPRAVADRVDALRARAQLVVDGDEALLHLHARLLETDVVDDRRAPDRDEHLVEHHAAFASHTRTRTGVGL